MIIEDDRAAFEHVILFATDTKSKLHLKLGHVAHAKILHPTAFAKDLTPQNLVQLLSLQTNLLIAVSQKQNFVSQFAAEFSLTLPPPSTPLLSYFPERDEPSTVIPITPPKSPLLTPGTGPVWFKGVPFSLGNSPYLVPILNAPAEAFAADADAGPDALVDAAERAGEGLWAGSQLGVVTGFQVAGDARVAWVGGAELFSDAFAQKEYQYVKFSLVQLFITSFQGCQIRECTVCTRCRILDLPRIVGVAY